MDRMTTNTVELPNGIGTLRPTLGAAKNINAYFGGFVKAMERIRDLDLDAMIVMVAFALDKERADVENGVWKLGTKIVSPLSKYITLLANGGNPAESKETKGTGEA